VCIIGATKLNLPNTDILLFSFLIIYVSDVYGLCMEHTAIIMLLLQNTAAFANQTKGTAARWSSAKLPQVKLAGAAVLLCLVVVYADHH